MNTIMLNMSPKGNSNKCNSSIICNAFIQEMKNPCKVMHIANSDFEQTSQYIREFDNIIFVLPLYIHAMPGIMMEFIEYLRPSDDDNKAMGFIIQAGFIESAQGRYVEPYLRMLATKLNYKYLGTVYKGEAAAIYMFPRMFKKVIKRFNELGRFFEINNSFDEDIIRKFAEPYELSVSKAKFLQFVCNIGLNDIGWHRVLKKNNALDKRLDRPFI